MDIVDLVIASIDRTGAANYTDGNNDGVVTWEEFYDYYADLSMSTPSDEYFVRMMESTWQVPEHEDAEVTK